MGLLLRCQGCVQVLESGRIRKLCCRFDSRDSSSPCLPLGPGHLLSNRIFISAFTPIAATQTGRQKLRPNPLRVIILFISFRKNPENLALKWQLSPHIRRATSLALSAEEASVNKLG